MYALRTAVIEHTNAHGTHHDWLIEDPTLPDPKAPDARLWTARVLPPPEQWPALGRFMLQPIPPHRRHYLRYQGEVSGNRGRVRRVDAGRCWPVLWTQGQIVLDADLQSCRLRLKLNRLGGTRWSAVVI